MLNTSRRIFSFGVVIVCALVYYILNAIPWLANLGRREQGKKVCLLSHNTLLR